MRIKDFSKLSNIKNSDSKIYIKNSIKLYKKTIKYIDKIEKNKSFDKITKFHITSQIQSHLIIRIHSLMSDSLFIVWKDYYKKINTKIELKSWDKIKLSSLDAERPFEKLSSMLFIINMNKNDINQKFENLIRFNKIRNEEAHKIIDKTNEIQSHEWKNILSELIELIIKIEIVLFSRKKVIDYNSI